MKAWLKGGLIVSFIFIILRLTFGNSFFGIPLTIFSAGIFTGVGALINFFIPLIISFILGAIIGSIIGVLRRKNSQKITNQ